MSPDYLHAKYYVNNCYGYIFSKHFSFVVPLLQGKKMYCNIISDNIIAPPMEPFPIINECQTISRNDIKTTCTISTSQSVEISCTASGYYPDIDLYFLHGSTSLYAKDTIEVTNLDGTKNKTIYANDYSQ